MMIADIAVLSTRLPFVDRGTLSQAWYDALHLAHTSSTAPAQVRSTARALTHALWREPQHAIPSKTFDAAQVKPYTANVVPT